MKMAHEAITLKLRVDVDQADRDLTNFIIETKVQDSIHKAGILSLGVWLIGVTVRLQLIIIILLLAEKANSERRNK